MSVRRPSIMIFWLVLQLLLGQQLALAHKIDHVGEYLHEHHQEHHHERAGGLPAQVSLSAAATAEDDDGHGAPHALADVCTTCLAVVGLDAGLCPVVAGSGAAPLAPSSPSVAVSPAPTFLRHLAFRSRAPPSLPS